MDSGIYLLLNTVNDKKYTGSSKNLTRRKHNHRHDLKRGKHCNRHLQAAWNKYGGGAFHWEILMYCREEDLLYWEDWWMNFFDSRNPDKGYNLLSADRKVFSEETRARMSAARKGKPHDNGQRGKKRSDAARANMSKARRGVPSPNGSLAKMGHLVSEETRAKLSAAGKGRVSPNKGKKHSEESLAKMSAAHSGAEVTPEHRAKISESLKGRPSPMRGKTHTEEAKANMAAARIGRKHSEETKAKLSEARRRTVARKAAEC